MPGPVLFERKRMTKSTYQALKKHIMKEREKKKQEQEADLALEQARKEAEGRKRKEKENKNSLQQTKTEISKLELKLEEHKKEKSKLFAQLRTILDSESSKKQNEKKNDPQMYMGQSGAGPASTQPMPQFMTGTGHMGRPVLYKPLQHSMPGSNRQSPSPSPQSAPGPMYAPFSSQMYQKPQASIPASKPQQPTPYNPVVAHQPRPSGVMFNHRMPSPASAAATSGQFPPHAANLSGSSQLPGNMQSLGHLHQQTLENMRGHEDSPRGLGPQLLLHQTQPAMQKGSIMTGFPVHSTSQLVRHHHPYQRPSEHSRNNFY